LANYNRYWNVIAYDQAESSIVYSSDKVRGYFYNNFAQAGQLIVDDAANNTSTVIADAITTDPSNNIIVAGIKNGIATIWRYNSQGTPDSIFGAAGIQLNNPNAANDTPVIRSIFLDTAINNDPNNYRILVCGQWIGPSGGSEMMIQALNVNGQLDGGFNGGTSSFTLGINASCNDLIVDTNSNVYIAGESQTSTGASMDVVVLKYTKMGILDNTFAGAGSIVMDGLITPDTIDRGHGITLDASNNIFITGMTETSASTFMFIAKFDSNGSPIIFNATGNSVLISELDKSMGDDIRVDSQNNIIVSGFASSKPITASFYVPIGVWRYNADGSPDSTNDRVSGFMSLLHSNSKDSFQSHFPSDDVNISYLSMSMDSQDNIVVAGNAIYTISTQVKPALWRLNASGQIDSNWIFDKYYDNTTNTSSRAVHINSQNDIIYSAGWIENLPVNMYIMALH